MSYFSDLSVEEIDVIQIDKSYPSPEMQLLWRLEDLIKDYLLMGGIMTEIELSLSMPQSVTVTANDNELLYSATSLYSPALTLRCIRIAWAKLIRYGSSIVGVLENGSAYQSNLPLHHVLIQIQENMAA